MDREEFMRELEDMFQDEPDNNREQEEGKDADCKPE